MEYPHIIRSPTYPFDLARSILAYLHSVCTPEVYRSMENMLDSIIQRMALTRVSVLGCLKAGKTTLLNAIYKQKLMPAKPPNATAFTCFLRNDPKEKTPKLYETHLKGRDTTAGRFLCLDSNLKMLQTGHIDGKK